MMKERLFKKAVDAMDNYTKAIEMGLCDFANYYDARMRELLKEIKSMGWEQEFEEFSLVL